MAYGEHPLFTRPESADCAIWRYLDFTKFVSLLVSRTLYFSRADLLGDRFEGSYPAMNVTRRREAFVSTGLTEERVTAILKEQAIFFQNLPKFVFVNCWTVSDYESVALWNLYSTMHNGIALRSNVGRLIHALKDSDGPEAHVGAVTYIDYDSDDMPEGNLFHPFLHKRRSYDFEHELRGVVLDLGDATGNWKDSAGPPGIRMPVDLDVLLERVHVAPLAPEWFRELVAVTVERFSPGLEVRQSAMSAREPVY